MKPSNGTEIRIDPSGDTRAAIAGHYGANGISNDYGPGHAGTAKPKRPPGPKDPYRLSVGPGEVPPQRPGRRS